MCKDQKSFMRKNSKKRAISEKFQLNRILINESINNVEFLIKQLQILNVTWRFHT